MAEDLRVLHAALNSIIAGRAQPLLGPLKSEVAAAAATSAASREPSVASPRSLHDEVHHGHEGEMQIGVDEPRDAISPLGQIHVPIKSLYEVTQLRSLRSRQVSPSRLTTHEEPGSAQTPLADLVSEGKLAWADADRLVTRFLATTSHYLYSIPAGFDGTDTVRRASPLLFTAICTVSALHESRHEALFRVCSRELRRLISRFVFASRVTLDDFQGLCIASFWLSDISWSVSGLAIRRAFEFQLGSAFYTIVTGDSESAAPQPSTKMRLASRDDTLKCLRVWYLFFICDHHLAILYGRPSSFGAQPIVNDWMRYLAAVPASSTDTRIASQLELLLLLDEVTQLLGPNVRTRTPLIFKDQLELFDRRLDQWIMVWGERYEHHNHVDDFPRKALTLHYLFAKVFVASHVFRGLPSVRGSVSPVPAAFRVLAQSAVRSARAIIDLVTRDEAMQVAFVAMPHYYHTFIAYACSFLLKLCAELCCDSDGDDGSYAKDLGLDHANILSATRRIVDLCRRSDCASYHLVHCIGAGLHRLAASCEAALLRRQQKHAPNRGNSLAPANSSIQQQVQHEDVPSDSMPRAVDEGIGSGEADGRVIEYGGAVGSWSQARDGAMLFPWPQQEVAQARPHIVGDSMDYVTTHNGGEDTGNLEFQQDWESLVPAFTSEYMGFSLL